MITLIIAVAIGALTLSLLLSPIETLGWWAGWYGEGLEHPHEASHAAYRRIGGDKEPRQFVVYLDGIAKVGAENYDDVQGLLDRLDDALPHAVILGDLMPYSVRNVGLLDERPLARFWRRMFEYKLAGKHSLLAFSINIRNLFQVLVAADQRYGSVYGRGEAQVILTSLLRAGYVPGSGVPITILGYSGGVQIGIVAARFLKRALDAPLTVVSLAGVMASDAGLDALDRLYHLQSPIDRVPLYGRVLFPGRWPIARGSHWNRLRRDGRLVNVALGPMRHNGPDSYLDDEAFANGDDVDNQTATAAAIGAILREVDGSATGAARS
ncbi:MAG: hypothetical protein IT345_09535 [Trueperaceae bacterium]|nr:hypothetical protein [Trueperaceae bacterium]